MKIPFAISTQAILAGLACFLLVAPVSAQSKYAVIDLKKVFDGYWKTKQADAQLKERGAEFQKQGKDLQESYQKANEEYKKLLDSASDQAIASEEREKRKKTAEAKLRDIQEIETQINQFERSARNQLGELTRRMRDSVLRKIQEVIAAKAKSAGYALVWDTAAESKNETPIIVFSSGENDLSDTVLAELNVDAPAEFLKPAADKPAAEKNAPAPAPVPAKKDSKKK
jgi:outer membrane protein